MKLLHLADLHIGKHLHKHSLLEDQKYILDQILAIAEEEQPDAVIIAGDLYQRSNPSPEALTLCSRFLTAVSDLKIPCYLISGNHDSAERVLYLSAFAERCGIHIAGGIPGEITEFRQDDAFGTVHFHLMPYFTPLQLRHSRPGELPELRTYEDAARYALSLHQPTPDSDRHIMVCHQFLTGAICCDSEEPAVGGLDNLPVSLFDQYDYVALGHLHGPQSVGRSTIRYAGSPLKYSFSEVNQKKSVTIVEMRKKGDTDIRQIPLRPLREMQVLTSSFAELMQMPACDDYLQIQLTDLLPPPDAARILRSVFPNLLLLTVRNGKQQDDQLTEIQALPEQTDFMTLLQDFYAMQNGGNTMSEPQTEIALRLLQQLEKEVIAE